ncbi:MAG: SPFH domain-containing protein [Anaerolineales bacterium]
MSGALPGNGAAPPAFGRPAWVIRLRRQLSYYLLYFLEGDHTWGQTRLIAALVVALIFVLISRAFESIPSLPLYDAFIDQLGLREFLNPALINLGGFFVSFFSRQVLRHAIPAALGFVLAVYYGASYLRDLLELPDLKQGLNYLAATVFGRGYPRMSINGGQASVADPETNPMLKIGGPGWVDIKIGNAALFEKVIGPSAVLGAGTHFIRRFETLREAFDLREIDRVKNDVKLMTKDGVPIVLNELRVRFRIRARELRTESNPFPAMTSAIRRAAYSRKVNAKGLEVWAEMVTGAARGTIGDWISRHRMDELVPPPRDGNQPEDPAPPPYRQALHALFHDKQTRLKFADMGAEVIWVSVGHLRPDPDVDPELAADRDVTGRDKIHAQLIDTWKSSHAARAQDEISDARAYARWLSDTARAEAESELILALTAGLTEARASGLPLDDVLADRLIEYVGDPGPRDAERRPTLLVVNSLLDPNNPPPATTNLLTAD